MPRERLPDRRPNETMGLVYDGTLYAVTVGFQPDTGEPREVIDALIRSGWLKANEATDPTRLGEVMADLADCWAHGTLAADP